MAALVALSVAAFLVLAYRPTAISDLWLARAREFNAALSRQAWSDLYISRHPGFTVMAIGGVTLAVYDRVQGTPLAALFSWASPPLATRFGREMAAGEMGLALVLAALLFASGLALRRLTDWPTTLAAVGLLAFAPFYLSRARAIHVDALLSALLLLAALLLLIYFRTGQTRYLLCSGLVTGAALLTKSPALFMAPYAGLVLLVRLVQKVRAGWPDRSSGRAAWLAAETWRTLIGPGLLWGLMVMLIVALWPPLWVQPLEVLQDLFVKTAERVENPHFKPRFLLGDAVTGERPPVLFYPVTMLFNTTFVTLTLAAIALGHYTLWRRRVRPALDAPTFWLMAAYVFFFTVQMTIGARQVSRYVLPAHLMLEVLAAVGLAGLIDGLRRIVPPARARLSRALPASLAALVIGMQAAIALPYMPYYGAHHNQLLGGNRIAQHVMEIMEQNEGTLYVARYLRSQPDPRQTSLGVTARAAKVEMRLYFSGLIDREMPEGLDYYLFSFSDLQRGNNVEIWGERWEQYEGQAPVLIVRFDAVDFLRLYAAEGASEPTEIIRRGGDREFVILALIWAAGLAAALIRVLHAAGRSAPDRP